MKSVILFGSTTGNTQTAADLISLKLGNCESHNVLNVKFDLFETDLLILGSSTWGVGDLQDDWERKINELKNSKLKVKNIAFFGTGDQYSYSDSFVDAIGKLYNAVIDKGINIVGMVDSSEYNFSKSEAVVDGKFVGLPLDYDNDANACESKINKWVKQIVNECK
ncbi:MAG: flavodoxin [Candidatus Delongbacteria bacterium]|nr:flavodoxin [Candidatus Delongbacteria bacterium]MBN2834843.1 flavodoxin [Candidatus Delongbacteria bacterium]